MNQTQAEALARVQIAMWLPAKCAQCGQDYESVDDFMARNPRAGYGWVQEPTENFVDEACWPAYEEARG